jgi:hypothetical protein
MTARRPNLPAALGDLGLAIGAGALGAAGAGWITLACLVVLHLGVWAFIRREGLARIARARIPRTLAISVALIAAIDAGAFLIGAWLNQGAR